MTASFRRTGLALTLLAFAATPALAHLKVTKSDPANEAVLTASPAAVTVWFSQMPAAGKSTLAVDGPSGAVALGTTEIGKDMSLRAAVTTRLAPGAYTITWQTAGEDGHPQTGKVTFALKAAAPPDHAGGGPMPVALRFAAMVGDRPFACRDKYEGLGTTASTVQVTDFRFYASGVRLVRDDGVEVPVSLTQDGLWQNEDVALVDFEDGTGSCVNGTPDVRTVIEGVVPAGHYTAVRFAVGLPFDTNHREVTLQASPLNLSRMFWNWNAGYKYMRLDIRSTGQPKGWMIHLGSTGCEPDDSPSALPISCRHANLVAVDLPFVAERDVIQFDLKSLLAESNVDVNQPDTAAGCMSGPTDSDCTGLFHRLGLPVTNGAAGTQQVFSVRHAQPTLAAPK